MESACAGRYDDIYQTFYERMTNQLTTPASVDDQRRRRSLDDNKQIEGNFDFEGKMLTRNVAIVATEVMHPCG